MPSALRTYLKELKGKLLHVRKEVDPLTQLGTLSSQSDRPIMFENLKAILDGLCVIAFWQPGRSERWPLGQRLKGCYRIHRLALRRVKVKVEW